MLFHMKCLISQPDFWIRFAKKQDCAVSLYATAWLGSYVPVHWHQTERGPRHNSYFWSSFQTEDQRNTTHCCRFAAKEKTIPAISVTCKCGPILLPQKRLKSTGVIYLFLVQYCAKVMRTNFDEFRALFSSKYRRTFDRFFATFARQLNEISATHITSCHSVRLFRRRFYPSKHKRCRCIAGKRTRTFLSWLDLMCWVSGPSEGSRVVQVVSRNHSDFSSLCELLE